MRRKNFDVEAVNDASEEKRKRERWLILLLLLLVCIAFIVFSVWRGIVHAGIERRVPVDYDRNADVLSGEDDIDADLLEELREKAEAGRIRMCMNSNPCFNDSDSKGLVDIENKEPNRFPLFVEFVLDSGEVVYTSGLIPVGSGIKAAKLDQALEKGSYECTAYFHNVDPDTGEVLGSGGVRITLTVLS